MPFSWTRASAYDLVTIETPNGAIAGLRADGDESAYKLDAPQLFREFAALSGQDGKAYQGFAVEYGLLGLSAKPSGARTESLDAWALEATDLWRIVTAWDLIRGTGDPYEDAEEDLLGPNAKGPTSDRRRRLAEIVQAGINGAIARQIHRHLSNVPPTVNVLVPHLQLMPGATDFAIMATPTTPIDLIWHQAVQAIKGWATDYSLCRCGNWIPHPPGKRGPRQKTCSDRCRALFDQQAEAEARRMARSRVRTAAIVAATGLRQSRVKSIISEERERRRRIIRPTPRKRR